MKFAAVLAFAATAVLAAPAEHDVSAVARKVGEQRCLGKDRGKRPGSWVYHYCPEYYFIPNSLCKTVPGDGGSDYPSCCPQYTCPDWPNWPVKTTRGL